MADESELSTAECEFLNSVADGVTSESVDAGTVTERYSDLEQKDTFKSVIKNLSDKKSDELVRILANTDEQYTDEALTENNETTGSASELAGTAVRERIYTAMQTPSIQAFSAESTVRYR